MGTDRPDAPEFQLGEGCLADQLIGQYLADIAGLGPLLDPAKIRKALESIYKYNHRSQLFDHDSVQRIYALNDEPALLICDYGKGARPRIPFPYYAEAWTGIEYLVAAQFIHAGMVDQGLETIENVRRRFDGERRNPWDEPECGHHYARAMSAWSSVIALSGFDYHGAERAISLMPKISGPRFRSFWSAGSGWGLFSIARAGGRSRAELELIEGSLALRSIRLGQATSGPTSVTWNGRRQPHQATSQGGATKLVLAEDIVIPAGGKLVVTI
jgi:hypothetical protein